MRQFATSCVSRAQRSIVFCAGGAPGCCPKPPVSLPRNARARRLPHAKGAAGGRECRKRRTGAQEIERLCALHGAEREAALEKLKVASGMTCIAPWIEVAGRFLDSP